jgi:lipoate-protein ligase B
MHTMMTQQCCMVIHATSAYTIALRYSTMTQHCLPQVFIYPLGNLARPNDWVPVLVKHVDEKAVLLDANAGVEGGPVTVHIDVQALQKQL